MDEKIIESGTWGDRLLYPYHVLKNYLGDKKFVDNIKTNLRENMNKNRRPGDSGPESFNGGATGACEIVIPGVGFECERGLTEQQCRQVILEAQRTNRGIWGKFRLGGQCSK